MKTTDRVMWTLIFLENNKHRDARWYEDNYYRMGTVYNTHNEYVEIMWDGCDCSTVHPTNRVKVIT